MKNVTNNPVLMYAEALRVGMRASLLYPDRDSDWRGTVEILNRTGCSDINGMPTIRLLARSEDGAVGTLAVGARVPVVIYPGRREPAPASGPEQAPTLTSPPLPTPAYPGPDPATPGWDTVPHSCPLCPCTCSRAPIGWPLAPGCPAHDPHSYERAVNHSDRPRGGHRGI